LLTILLAPTLAPAPALAQGTDAPGLFGCTPSGDTLCLQRGRFAVTVVWQTFFGTSGPGVPRPVTDHTGAFWFFDPNSLELMVRIVDTRAQNGYFGVFYGSVTNVGFGLTVTDTATGQVLAFVNPLGTFAGGGLAEAFAADPGPGTVPAPLTLWTEPAGRPGESTPGGTELSVVAGGSSLASPATRTPPCTAATGLCLVDDRFLMEVTWQTPQDVSRRGFAVSLTPDTGAFWLTRPADLEVFVRIVDGRALNGSFWVLAGSLALPTFELKVTDTATGALNTYLVPAGTFASIVDLNAFPGN